MFFLCNGLSRARLATAALVAAACFARADEVSAPHQVFLPERTTRGPTGISQVQPIDSAAWVWHADSAPTGFVRFRCPFSSTNGTPLRVDVSADERFILFLDGREVGRGPHMGMPEHWFYMSYEIPLSPGAHELEAVVWRVCDSAPIAQTSYTAGFILKAHGVYEAALTTGTGAWTAARLASTRLLDGYWSWTGKPCVNEGTSFYAEKPAADAYRPVRVVRAPLRAHPASGMRPDGWILFPAVLPAQHHRACAPGRFVAAQACDGGARPYQPGDRDAVPCADLNALLKEGKKVVIPPRTNVRVLWDLADYYCVWPRLETAGGKGAEVRWHWYESLVDPKTGLKGDRRAYVGKKAPDVRRGLCVFKPDGRADGVFEAPWWRAGRWCELEISVGEEPLALTRLQLFETRYPLTDPSSFSCDDPTVDAILGLCVRGLEMCMHEMYFDCPYYEQQMYVGDTRVEMLTTATLTRDDRLARHGMALFDYARRDDGMLPMNWPTRALQESATYTLCWPLMLADQAWWRADAGWLKARVPGLRHTMAAFAGYEGTDGLLRGLPGWCFADWVPAWGGVSPDGGSATQPSAFNNLFYLAALRAAATVEDAIGEGAFAAAYRARADRLAAAIARTFWVAEKALLSDTVRHDTFSEHVQCLALLYGAVPEKDRARCFEALVSTPNLARTTVYFSHYLFETYLAFGRTDLFLKRLDLWRGYVADGLKTPLESPGKDARSDCHAWGAHPLFHMHAGVLGIRPSKPAFGAVRMAPCPGPLRRLTARTPHPQGFIESALAFDGPRVTGTVTLPGTLAGTFVWRGEEVPLRPGRNDLALPRARAGETSVSVRVKKGFWADRLATNRTATLSACLAWADRVGAVWNFQAAADGKKGVHKALQFTDAQFFENFEGAARILADNPDPALEARLQTFADLIARAQEPDGYLYTPRTVGPADGNTGLARWSNLTMSHELYQCGHLYEAAVAWKRATGKTDLLDVACRNADLLVRLVGTGPGQRPLVGGHEGVKLGLLALAKETGRKAYEDLARRMASYRGRADLPERLKPYEGCRTYAQDHAPVADQLGAAGHCVRATYLAAAVSELAADGTWPEGAEAVQAVWKDAWEGKTYVTGGGGCRHETESYGAAFELPRADAYQETCAAIGTALWQKRMFDADRDARYVDWLERVLYNNILAGVSLSGDRFFYQNPLESAGGIARFDHHWCFCCPPNLLRFLPQVPSWSFALDGKAIYWNLFMDATARLSGPDGTLDVETETDYPFDGRVTLRVTRVAGDGTYALHVRIPDWARGAAFGPYRAVPPLAGAELSVNGTRVDLARVAKGYCRVERTWKVGDCVTLVLPMAVRRIEADARIVATADRVAFARGPLVYCAEGADNGGHVLDVQVSDASPAVRSGDVCGLSVPLMTVPATRVWKGCRGSGTPAQDTPVALTLVPYFLWANRGAGEMAVWLPAKRTAVSVWGRPSASSCAVSGTPYALNDGREPRGWFDGVRHFAFPFKAGAEEWVAYELPVPEAVSGVDVRWGTWPLWRAADRTAPPDWRVDVRADAASPWRTVADGRTAVVSNGVARLVFSGPVEAQAIRLVLKQDAAKTIGIREWTLIQPPSAKARAFDALKAMAASPDYWWAWTHTWCDLWWVTGDPRLATEENGTFRPKPVHEVTLKSHYSPYACGERAVVNYSDLAGLVGTWHAPRYYAANRATLTAAIRRQWQEFGGLAVFSWHMDHPYCTNGFPLASYRFKTDGAARNVVRQILDGTGGPCGRGRIDGKTNPFAFPNPRAWFLAQLRDAAAFINGLNEETTGRPIPVVIRYPHEMEAPWFWWGRTWCEPADFRALCRLIADYLRAACGPDRILFAYTPDRHWTELGRPGEGEGTFLACYPGDAYVDLVGFDDYSIGNGTDDQVEKAWKETVRKLRAVSAFAEQHGKVAALTEAGGLKKRDDFFVWLHRTMTAPGVRCAFANTWSGPYGTIPDNAASARDEEAFVRRPEVLMDRDGRGLRLCGAAGVGEKRNK